MNSAASGFLLLVLAGAMNGSFTLPMKFTRRWAWENTWFVWTIFALLIFPPLLTLTTVPALGSVYHQASSGVLWTVIACGAGWGVSQVFLGLAVDAIGMALSFSVILGLSAAIGSVVPLVQFHSNQMLTAAGLWVLAGVVLVLIGVGVCAIAGRRREAAIGQAPAKVSVTMGLLFSTISGIGSALVNLGLTFGHPLLVLAQNAGASPAASPNAVWMPLMVAGGIPNLIYCLHLLRKNHTGSRFVQSSAGHSFLAALMAFFWFASTVIYGIAAGMLGDLGTVLGWPLFMSLIVITASLWGVGTGEWRAAKKPLRIMFAGVAILVLAIFVLAQASY